MVIEPMFDFGGQCCCTPMLGLIEVTPRSPFTIIVAHFTNQPVWLRKRMRVSDLAKTLACFLKPWDPSIL